MLLRQLFDADTWTYTYLIADKPGGDAVLIDPVREQVERDLKLIDQLGLKLRWVLDTHTHADHITAASQLRERSGAKLAIGAKGPACSDLHMAHGEVLEVGELTIKALATPGHTPDSTSFLVGSHVFTGDALLIRGCGRTDFQGGDPDALFHSLHEVLLGLPEDTQVWPGHDYQGLTVSTIGEERAFNPRLAPKTPEAFAALMNNLNLPEPRHIHTAVPANMECGCEPHATL